MQIENIRENLLNPDKDFYPVIMWFWNDDIEEAEIEYQIRDFKDHNIFTFFIHPMFGFKVPYLSERYFELVSHAVRTAKKEEMKFWIYDEYNWPSGPVGGQLLREHKWAQATKLKYDKIGLQPGETAAFSVSGPVVAAHFVAPGIAELVNVEEDEGIVTYTNRGAEAGILYVSTRHYHEEVTAATYGAIDSREDNGYIDLMNPEAVRKFFDMTLEKYKEYIGEEFGKTVVGVFTDEPTFSVFSDTSKGCLPYTGEFFSEFRRLHGYDAKEKLYMFYTGDNTDEAAALKHDWYETLSRLFETAFCVQYKKWCEDNKLLLTGHLIGEECMALQVYETGKFYDLLRHYDIPGMDSIMTKQNLEGEAFNLAGYMIGSAAHFAGRRRVLSETYSGSGWDFGMSDLKKTANRLLMQGVNFYMYMGAYYSIKGMRKTLPGGYPPTHNSKNPQFYYYNDINRYIARMAWLSSETHMTGKTLVMHPITSGFSQADVHYKYYGMTAEFYSQASHADMDATFSSAVNCLEKLNIGFEVGFETALEQAEVREGKICLAGAEYEVVIFPAMNAVKGATADLIKEFIRTGGKVIFFNEIPELDIDRVKRLNWLESPEIRAELGKLRADSCDRFTRLHKYNDSIYVMISNQNFFSTMEPLKNEFRACYKMMGITEEISIKGRNILSNRRKCGDVGVYTLINDADCDETAELRLNEDGFGVLLDMEELTVSRVFKSGETVKVYFRGLEGKILFTGKKEQMEEIFRQFEKEKTAGSTLEMQKLTPDVKISENLFRLKQGLVSDGLVDRVLAMSTEDMSVFLRRTPNIISMGEDGFKKSFADRASNQAIYPLLTFGRPFVAVSEFTVETDTVIKLILENEFGVRAVLNGKMIENFKEKRFMHPGDMEADVTGMLNKGINQLILIGRCVPWGRYHTVPFAALAGDFKVAEDRLCSSEGLSAGDITVMGYPYYMGEIEYNASYMHSGETAFLKVESTDPVSVIVNGKHAGDIVFAPYMLDLTNVLECGENNIKIVLKTKPNNLYDKVQPLGVNNVWICRKTER